MRDTIFALATAMGRAAVAVVRMSGPAASAIAKDLCGSLPQPRLAGLRRLRSRGAVLDECLVLWMPGPASFTGEDCVEFHLHGGPAVVEGVSLALAEAGARLAEPGEFTRRAFEAGRLDLTQAEAIADLIDAETQAQREQATDQLAGALSGRYQTWRERLLDALALIEAGIDFPEDDVPGGVVAGAATIVDSVAAEIGEALAHARGETVREGWRVALVGAPNVGKSSLLNALAGRDAAMVTPVAGTTRDVVEVHLVLGGQLVRLADTAGLRPAADELEAEGIRRARIWSSEAQIRLAVADASRPDTIELALTMLRPNDVLVLNKIDVADTPEGCDDAIRTNALSGSVGALRSALMARVTAGASGHDFPAITRKRHRELLGDCREHLARASAQSIGADLQGEDLRLAIRSLERVTGRSDPEAVLDRVFSTFCIGK